MRSRGHTERIAAILLIGAGAAFAAGAAGADRARPNILLAISDDQSFPHASAYGDKGVRTPSFDQVAASGVLFTRAFAASPGCSPCRAALLTGRQTWQIQHAGTHASSFPAEYVTYPDLLEGAGYHVGYTGKGWGPGNWKTSGRSRNPAGPSFARHKLKPPQPGISSNDYAANFADFLSRRPTDRPFCFWYGASEPHRSFSRGAGLKAGKKLEEANVPAFLPDQAEIRSDILDYYTEIEWFDRHLGGILGQLEKAGELKHTLVIVTSDNGMAFPRAKANCYDFGIRMPLAIAWPDRVPGGRTVDDLVGFVDLTATILDAAGVPHPEAADPALAPAGRSLMTILASRREGRVDSTRRFVFSARERHSSSRYHSLSYPQRAIRSQRYLFIRNFTPERWPAGTPRKYGRGGYPRADQILAQTLGPAHGGYHDIDACPSLSFLIDRADDPKIGSYLHLAVDKRPAEELFDVEQDPACLKNLAADPQHQSTRAELARALASYLKETGDPRVLGQGDVWETYPRYSGLRWFPTPDWAKQNPGRVPEQKWLEARRPR